VTPAPVTLLVEDDEDVIDSYSRTFARDGISLDVAETWADALSLFRVVGHRLVIADYNLPGDEHDNTGLRLLVEMKLLVPSAQLVLISGALSQPAEQLAAQIPLIDAFYPKTSDLPDTLAKLARSAVERADDETNWHQVGSKYLTPTDVIEAALAEIDEALRADVAKVQRRG
jgi:DNA-binding NtrC family response regulator